METNNDSNIINLVSDMPHMNNQALIYSGYRRVQALQELQREGTLHISNKIPITGLGYFSHRVLGAGLFMEYESEAHRQVAVCSLTRYVYINPRDFQLLLGIAPKVAVSSLLLDSSLNIGVEVYGARNEYIELLGMMNNERFFQTHSWNSGEESEKKEKALMKKIKSTSLYRVNKLKGKQYYQLLAPPNTCLF